MKTILLIFGTRPEAIKLAPVYMELKKSNAFSVKVCVTGQHRFMLDQVLEFFEIFPDYDLDIMKKSQTLSELSVNLLNQLKTTLEDCNPDITIVQGDTTTTLMASLASFYKRIPVFHIEAGLRTYKKYSPYPEEMNRELVSRIASFHFAPTENAKQNLVAERIAEENISVTGNTVIDALNYTLETLDKTSKKFDEEKFQQVIIELLKNKYPVERLLDSTKKKILVTCHRRESFGQEIANICESIKQLAVKYKNDVDFIFPVHLNPKVQSAVKNKLNDLENVHLMVPLSYGAIIYLLKHVNFVLTDSGGIQEEAPSIGTPTLILRDYTERPEGVNSGCTKLIGTEVDAILRESQKLIEDKDYYKQFSQRKDLFGDGLAAKKIVSVLKERLS